MGPLGKSKKKSWENHRKIMRKSQENLRKLRENHRKLQGATWGALLSTYEFSDNQMVSCNCNTLLDKISADKIFDGQNFRQQVEISAILSNEIFHRFPISP